MAEPASLSYVWQPFASLSLTEFYRIAMARQAVFVVEQRCAYQEIDETDEQSWHLQVMYQGQLAAYARVIPPGVKGPEAFIGRVLTVARFRGQGLAQQLMQEAIRFCRQQYPTQAIRIGAQVYLQAFYASLGFVPCSDPYDEDGIMHIDMLLELSSAVS